MSLETLNYHVVKFSPKVIAEAKSNRVFWGAVTEIDLRGERSITIPITKGGKGTPHSALSEIPDMGGKLDFVTITTTEMDHARYLDQMDLEKLNFDYKAIVERQLIPQSVAETLDTAVFSALLQEENKVHNVTYDGKLDIFQTLSAVSEQMNMAAAGVPERDRFIILPQSAKSLLYADSRIMSADYVARHSASIESGKVNNLLNFEFRYVNYRGDAGLHFDILPNGNALWHCYAFQKMGIYQAMGFGAKRTIDGSGGVIQTDFLTNRGAYFINMPVSTGAKVVLPDYVVHFCVETAPTGLPINNKGKK